MSSEATGATGHGTATGEPSVSVVVAVYNMRRHIRQCIESVLAQSLRDMELILVDDASTDGTASILEEYARADSRVSILRQESNGGAQLARNAGIRLSRGRYIITLDHDDFLSPDALQSAVDTFNANKGVQCVCLREVRLLPDGRLLEHRQRNSFGAVTGMEAYRRSIHWLGITARMMVTRELQLRYPFDNCERVYGEDNTAQLQFLASPIVCSCEGIYYHRLLDTSLSHRLSLNNIRGNLRFTAMRGQLRDGGFGQEVMRLHETAFWESIVGSYQYYWTHRRRLTPPDRKEALRLIRHLWEQADMPLVRPRAKYRPGFMHMPAWWLFRMQMELYMALKSIAKAMVPGNRDTME